jgi:integrase/recombinase XerD
VKSTIHQVNTNGAHRDRSKVRQIKYLTDEELARLFAVIDSVRNRAIFRVAYHRGLRASEVGLLCMSDYRPVAGRLYVHRLKQGYSGEYSITDAESSALEAWLKKRGTADGPLFPSNRGTGITQMMLSVLMKRYCLAASIPRDKAHFHTLRHSCATSLLELGEDIAVVQDHLGHVNIANTLIYARITNRRRNDVARRLKGWK